MSDCTTCCGTGINSGVSLPTDPDNNIGISASGGFGGIDVTWTTPGLNDHAVAYTIVYRSADNDFAHAIERARVNGTFYFDRTESPNNIEWFFWIQNVSVNGTRFDPVGPASAIARPRIEDLLQQLTGKIDNGQLAQSLKGDIERIQTLSLDLIAERLARLTSEGEISTSLQGIQSHLDESDALIYQEQVTRAEETSALAQQINAVTANSSTGLANVQQTLSAMSDDINGLGSQYSVVLSASKDADNADQYLIGGFGLYNDGSEVQAGFDVDLFWVGRTNSNGIKPFIVDSATGEVFINQAVINELTFNKLRTADGSFIVDSTTGRIQADYLQVDALKLNNGVVGEDFQSSNYSATSGWKINADGSMTLNNVKARGDIEATTIKADAVNVVNTLNIAGNAVRLAEYAEVSESALHASSTTTLVTKTLDYTGSASGTTLIHINLLTKFSESGVSSLSRHAVVGNIAVYAGSTLIKTLPCIATTSLMSDGTGTDIAYITNAYNAVVRHYVGSGSVTYSVKYVPVGTYSSLGTRPIEGAVVFDAAKA